jgi:hypothetical protein
VATPLAQAAEPDALADWLTDRLARRPAGARARTIYHDPEMHKPGFRAVLDSLRPGPDDRLLEIACGGGVLLAWALETGCRVSGIDHSEEMVRLARERAPEADVVLGNAEALPFADVRRCACSSRAGGSRSSRLPPSSGGLQPHRSRSRAAAGSTQTRSSRLSLGRRGSWTRTRRAPRTAPSCSSHANPEGPLTGEHAFV